jgi:thioester reductase-like protein
MTNSFRSIVRGHRRRTVLITGASGVLGSALVPRLSTGPAAGSQPLLDVVTLTYRRPVENPHVASVRGDITAPRMGLSPHQYTGLAHRVDAVVHAAAVTVFNRKDGSLDATNVEGTRRVLQFAADAHAPVYHISTAYLHPTYDAASPRSAVGYAVSKRAAEDVVRASGVPQMILRPSIVVGDSRTGAISDFQGIYQVADAMFQGALPVLPFAPHWPLDLIPRDVVADVVARRVEQQIIGRELWLTTGERALRFDDALDIFVEHARSIGVPLRRPRFVPWIGAGGPDAAASLASLPRTVRRAVSRLVELFHDYVALDRPFESSLEALAPMGVPPLPDPRQTLRASLRYWSEATGSGYAREATA